MHTPSWQRTLWMIFTINFISAIGFSVMFPFLALYTKALGTNTGISLEFWAAMAFSGQALTMALTSPFWGALADRRGHKLMLERATFGGTLVLFLMAFARSAEELALLRAIQGAVTGTVAAASALTAATVPRERLGYAMGVIQLGTWIGIAAGPVIGGIIADAFGYRAAFIITAASLLLCGVLTYFFIPNAPPKARTTQTANASWRALLAAPGVGAVYTVRFLHQGGQTLLLPILPVFVVGLLGGTGQVNTLTGLTVGASSAAATLSAVGLGKLGDRIGHARVLLASLLVAGLAYLPMALVSEFWQLLVLSALTGAATGGVIPSLGALLARLTPAGTEGTVYGIDNSVSSAARAAAPLLAAGLVYIIGQRGLIALNGGLLLLAWCVALVAVGRGGVTKQGDKEIGKQGDKEIGKQGDRA